MTTQQSIELESRAYCLTPEVCSAMMKSYDIYKLTDDHSDAQQLASELNNLLREAYNVASKLQQVVTRI